jgi:hypothetical protein
MQFLKIFSLLLLIIITGCSKVPNKRSANPDQSTNQGGTTDIIPTDIIPNDEDISMLKASTCPFVPYQDYTLTPNDYIALNANADRAKLDNDYLSEMKIFDFNKQYLVGNKKRINISFDNCLNFTVNYDRFPKETLGFIEFFQLSTTEPSMKSFIINGYQGEMPPETRPYIFSYDNGLQILNNQDQLSDLIDTQEYYDDTRVLIYSKEANSDFIKFGHFPETYDEFRKTRVNQNSFQFHYYISQYDKDVNNRLKLLKIKITKNKDSSFIICLFAKTDKNQELKHCISGF